MVQVEICLDNDGKERERDANAAREVLKEEGSLVWLTANRSRDELKSLGDKFGFHGLAIEDATDDHERPKASIYQDHGFVLLFKLALVDGKIIQSPVAMFIGKNYLVTATDDPSSVFDDVATRWRSNHQLIHNRTTGALAYTLIDGLVDEYFPIIDSIGERLESIELELLESKNVHIQQDIRELRLDLLQLRRIIGPEREAINVLLRRDVPIFDGDIVEYLQDIYDHLLRALDWIETYRDTLSTLSDLQISVASHRLNQTMRTMTAWSIIFMATTLIAGIYGMNFKHMPELAWRLGYPASLILMVLVGGGIFFALRRRDWI